MRLVIVGGSDAGISAGLRAKELQPDTEVVVVVKDSFPNFSICGLPFLLSGEVDDWRNLAHRTTSDILKEGLQLMTEHTATSIAPDKKQVLVINKDGRDNVLEYDKLIICTGALPLLPDFGGTHLPGVFYLREMKDSFLFQNYLVMHHPKSIVIIGAGYIGMEMSDAMNRMGLSVHVIEYLPTILPFLAPSLGKLVCDELERKNVRVSSGVSVSGIEKHGDRLVVSGSNGFAVETDMVLISTGVRPETSLALSAGIDVDEHNAIRVNRKMETNIKDIYAAGDCIQTWHRMLNRHAYLPLGTTSHKQGRIAGENAVGGAIEYAGSLGTQTVKIFNLVAAGTGLNDAQAQAEGFDPLSANFETWDHKVYYPGAQKMYIRITGDRSSCRLLGAQIVGTYGTEVSKRIDVIATALYNGMKIDELSHLDLSYTPPLSSPWDPIQMAAQNWLNFVQVGSKK